tara:strand:+ start:4675 stop:4854 length:180 start_codon:yes stop_codon:yes gene_type:complete
MQELITKRLAEYQQGLEEAKAQVQRYIGAIAVLNELNAKLNDRSEEPISEDGLPDESGA